MEQNEQPERGGDGWFVTAAAVAGDLDNPFYREERQRDVWNEAAAIGYQVILFLGLAAAAGMLWIGGEPSMPYAVTLLAVLGIASIISAVYAARLGVDVDESTRMLRLRMVPFLALLILVVAGLVRVAPADGFGSGLAQGAVAGAALAVLWLAVKWIRARRRTSGAGPVSS
ncbi:hypothetical protein [Amycolatopsis antarctica]|uniref:hypothetical protein n=1 Tax=Amycolatopsis antarctica TaxID=1854586 RepID=UPI001055670D|nr:hypothetical protein [Amycolatopsis antarctica]